MALIRYNNPFRELESLFDEALNTQGQPSLSTPVSDVYLDDSEENMIVEAHLPGYEEDDVDIEIDEGALTIRAERSEKDSEENKGRKYIVRESSASFFRRIGLPQNVEEDSISAEFENGVLKIHIPMQELPKPKKVSIEKGKGSKKIGDKSKK